MHLFPLLLSASTAAAAVITKPAGNSISYVVKPKFVIISMFAPEAEIWYGIKEFNLLEKNITLPGLSPLFPDVHCTADGDICQVITGESGELNLPPS